MKGIRSTMRRVEPVVDLDGNVVDDAGRPYRDGMVFRCEPDGSQFEALAYNFRNSYEVCVDSFGTIWQAITTTTAIAAAEFCMSCSMATMVTRTK